MEDSIEVMESLYEASGEISGERFATWSKVIALLSIYARADGTAKPGTIGYALVHNLPREVTKILYEIEDVKQLCLSTLFDPRFKNQGFQSEERNGYTIGWLKKEATELETPREEEDQSTTEPEAKKKVGILWRRFDQSTETQKTGRSPSRSRADNYVHEFFGLPLQDGSSDPLKY